MKSVAAGGAERQAAPAVHLAQGYPSQGAPAHAQRAAPAAPRPYADATLGHAHLVRRYPRLALERDCVRVDRHFPSDADAVGGLGVAEALSLHRAVPVSHGVAPAPQDAAAGGYTMTSPPARDVPRGAQLRSVRVVFSTGLSEQARAAALQGAGAKQGDSLRRLLKFVVARTEEKGRRSGIMCLGGPVDAALDGCLVAERDENGVLRRAAQRHCRIQAGVDLAPTDKWLRLLDVTYQRLDEEGLEHHTEIVSMFLVDASACLPNQESWPQVWAEAQAARRLQTPAAAGPGAAPRPGPEAEPETARGDVPPATTVQGEAATEPGEALAAGSAEEDFIRLLNEPAGEPAEAVGDLTQALDAGLEGADAAAALAPSPKSDTDVVSLAAVPQASPGPEARAQGGTAPPPGLAQSTVPGLAPSDAPEAVDAVLEAAMDSSPVERSAAPDSVATNPAAGSVATAAAALPPSPALCTLGMHGAGVRLRTLSISLDGLLDYNLSDTGAGTFELGAESGVWGVTPASPGAVELEVEAPGDKSTTGEPGGSDLGGDLAGLFQDDDFVFAERLRSQGGMEVAAEEDAASAPVQPGEGGNGGAHLNDKDLAVSLTMAFRYFDAGGKGYLGTEELEGIVAAAQPFLHQDLVRSWVAGVSDGSSLLGGRGRVASFEPLVLTYNANVARKGYGTGWTGIAMAVSYRVDDAEENGLAPGGPSASKQPVIVVQPGGCVDLAIKGGAEEDPAPGGHARAASQDLEAQSTGAGPMLPFVEVSVDVADSDEEREEDRKQGVRTSR
ncbi:hypothetical protein F751_0172 [Auxenochlorella protothecoides]|uniref:DBC1/CARP1 catalytically inactive NUDIX hydrolase domain-containing protein n=1 Tax=Auxenochlorella protothecoides TaxID=3075 RepID=A0A087S9M1_AUXPR|nr:hypothetical protein F751_0172 [Auxenochlorella protothecoides]KFM22425.1 hypothetical protein F751_0172 [Auxenochlorella protothecoides]